MTGLTEQTKDCFIALIKYDDAETLRNSSNYRMHITMFASSHGRP